jgi:hypothetical protein
MVVNLGDYANDEDLHHNCEIGKKATGTSSLIAPGRGVFHTQSSGLWAITVANSSGRTGIIPNKSPLNTDAEAGLQVETRKGTAMYVQAGGAIKTNGRCRPDALGKFIAVAAIDVTATVNETTVEAALNLADRPNEYVYEGHEGEGEGLGNLPTDAATDEKIRVRIV